VTRRVTLHICPLVLKQRIVVAVTGSALSITGALAVMRLAVRQMSDDGVADDPIPRTSDGGFGLVEILWLSLWLPNGQTTGQAWSTFHEFPKDVW
jgi:hypothetical protein